MVYANIYSATEPASDHVSTYSHLFLSVETFSVKMSTDRHLGNVY